MPKVVALPRSFSRSEEAKELLLKAGFEVIWNTEGRPLKEAELIEVIKGADALITGIDEVTAKVLEAGAPTLKVVAKYGVGYDNIDVEAANRLGIPVTITPGAPTRSVAELALTLMLSVARHIPQMNAGVREGGWGRTTGSELGDKVLGVVGLGAIGAEVVKRAVAFDMKVIAYDAFVRQDMIDKYGVEYVTLPELYAQSDFITLHAPAIPETVGMINKESLAQMKKTAILINTARGDLVVEQDLYEALSSGQIAGAGLDTFVQEPPATLDIVGLPNVVTSPHVGSNTVEAGYRMAKMAAEEAIRAVNGEAPKFPVKVPVNK
ncbi:D-3-phosphoglycerate dehydrogenase [Paenibacillus sophorae]|uniref:2-oxoglutarate reductase n=1 Tax=Paenibacillus sophorae TaxID=1333845 RepID=A0A1H8IK94_9BACL|nr:phosphoglycerate dehydrogenase [Paenibacillus sophorae]QWU15985.1 phosphoglycerate dehydrogenase [Paenibacillus sophorae]SEN68616.1 D-3-phosphoglycerate dehydrogenase [Paenibacillus sophorae]